MTERRPHWDDDLIDAVAACLDTSGDDISFDTYTAIAAVEDWARWEHVPKGTLRRLERAEAAMQRVRELCDLTERTALDAMPELEGKVVVYTSLVRRALDGGAE